MKKYFIGISPRYWSNETNNFIRVSTQYINQLQKDFIVPIILVNSPNLKEQLEICDGFLILGGDDIDPVKYGEDNSLGLSKEINAITDDIDEAIIKYATKFKKPILGICRGEQALCAFMNGKLSQDIKADNLEHPLLEEHLHYVEKVSNFGVAALLPDKFLVNSYHHQAVLNVTDDFSILFKNGNTIEAIEHKTLPFIGVQWHPERYYTKESEIIFNYFFNKLGN